MTRTQRSYVAREADRTGRDGTESFYAFLAARAGYGVASVRGGRGCVTVVARPSRGPLEVNGRPVNGSTSINSPTTSAVPFSHVFSGKFLVLVSI